MKIFENTIDLNLDGEIWKDIEEYNGNYQISNFGRVKSFKGKDIKILKQIKNGSGYLYISLCKNRKVDNKRIHILMFENFNNCKLKDDECVHHLDENKINNDLNNFQLMNKSDHNSLHKSEENNPFYGKHHSESIKKSISESKSGENNSNHKLFEQDIIDIRASNILNKELAKIYNVSTATISLIKNNKRWKHILNNKEVNSDE